MLLALTSGAVHWFLALSVVFFVEDSGVLGVFFWTWPGVRS